MGNVKIFRSQDYGAPTLNGTAGGLIPVLDACLVNGYGTQNLATLTHSNGTVTATTTLAHSLLTYSRQTISGANETGYNGEFVINVVDAYTFTYTASGISVSPATGTITTKSASAGWTKPYNGTNLAAYRPGAGTQHYLRIDDTGTSAARCIGYESMSGISSGTNPFPTNTQVTGGLYWQKSVTTDSTSRNWMIIADDRTMYMEVQYSANNTYQDFYTHGFGDYISYKSGDVYNSFIAANTGPSAYQYMFFMHLVSNVTSITNSTVYGFYGARSYTQLGTSAVFGKIGDYSKAAQTGMGMTTAGLTYPHPVDGGLHMCPVQIGEGAAAGAQSVVRGKMRGIWNPLHPAPLNHGDTFLGNGSLAGKTFYTWWGCGAATALCECMVDISLTWDV